MSKLDSKFKNVKTSLFVFLKTLISLIEDVVFL